MKKFLHTLFLAAVAGILGLVFFPFGGSAAEALSLVPGSLLQLEEGYLTGIPLGATCEQIKMNFANGELSADWTLAATGRVITSGAARAELVVLGDINGDGKINSSDYLRLKRYFSGGRLLGSAFKAADIQTDGKLSSPDYIRLKKYFSGEEIHRGMDAVPAEPGGLLYVNGNARKISWQGISSAEGALEPKVTFAEKATMTIAVPELSQFNQYILDFQSTQPLSAKIFYSYRGRPYWEEFFLEKTQGSSVFRSYIASIDAKRIASEIVTIEFSNLGDEVAVLTLEELNTSKSLVPTSEVYLKNEYYKIGIRAQWGGGMSYLEYLKEKVCMVSENGDYLIGVDYDQRQGASVMSRKLNLLNCADQGRLVQQSYYGTSEPPYICGEYMGSRWAYNPVQGGDKLGANSRLIDCVISENSIYVKCRPLDWAKGHTQTPSYMETVYTLDGPAIWVDNRFVDFSGYTHSVRSQELPAFYVVEPLNSFRYATLSGAEKWSDQVTINRKDDLIFWPDAGYPTVQTEEYWSAWTNAEEDGFGVGLFVPSVSTVLSGVSGRGAALSGTPCMNASTCYSAPLLSLTMKSFVPMEYSYIIAVGRVSEMREIFAAQEQKIDNSGIVNY